MRTLRLLLLFVTAACAHSQDLHELASTASASEVQKAIAAGADPNARDAHGQTPLMYAADHGNLEALSALTSAGADIDARSYAGWTALMHVVRDPVWGWDVATRLLALGADPRIVNHDGKSARDIAASVGHSPLVRLFEGAEVLYEIVGDAGVSNVMTAHSPNGLYAVTTVGAEDFVLARRTPGGSEIVVRLQRHDGLMTHLEDLGLPGRWSIIALNLVDANGDRVPDVLFRGGCECHGWTIHALVDGATGTAYSVEAAPFGDPSLPRNAYVFPPETPAAVQRFMTGALATEEYSYPFEEQADFEQRVRITAP